MLCYIYILYVHVVKKTDNVSSRLLPVRQWPHGNYALGHMMYAHDEREDTLSVLLTTYIYYAHHLTSVRFEQCVCHEQLPTSYIYVYMVCNSKVY